MGMSRSSDLLLRLLILVLATLDNTALSATMKTHHRPPRRVHLKDSVANLRGFACREPQPRAYLLRDLMQELDQNPGESPSQPVYIVVKRCDGHSGCCTSPEMSCTPVATSTYYDEIEIEIWSLSDNSTRRQWIKVEQHGRCACQITTISDRYELEHKRPNVRSV